MIDTDVSTKDHPGEFDALETAKPDEPIFVVQGGDPLGPPTVQFWADAARKEARRIMDGHRAGFEPADERDEYKPTSIDERDADKLLRKATNAEQVSWTMKAYQRGDVQPSGGRASYNDLPEVLTADGVDRAAKRRSSIAMVGQLQNSLAIAFEVAEGLSKLDLHPETEAKIRGAVTALQEAAREVEPRRGNERS